MYNNLLTIGPVTIHGYGLMIGIGIIAAYWLAEKRGGRMGFTADEVFSLTLWGVIGGILGAKILYLITILGELAADPAAALKDAATGFVVYGGIIGGVLTAWVWARLHGKDFLPILDLIFPSIALGQGFGRIGCFLAGCCYGMEYTGPGALTFTHSDFAPNGIGLFPTQPLYSLLDFLHCGLLLGMAGKVRAPGQLGAIYLILYACGRFLMEFFRGDAIRGSVGILSTSQFISIFILSAGVLLYIAAPRFVRKGADAA